MSKVAIIYHSGYGHTAVVAEEVANGAREAGAETTVHPVALDTDFDALFDSVADADAIIFGSPTYMGTVSAPFKAFMDASSKIWMAGGWKDKLAAGFTNSASLSGDKLNTLVTLAVFAGQQGMIWVNAGEPVGNMSGNSTSAPEAVNRLGSSLGVMTQSDNAGPDVTPPAGDRATARALGTRVAKAAARWGSGAL